MREVFIDVETTGLGYTDEVIEVAVVDADGVVLMDTLVKPVREHPSGIADEIHGITLKALEDAPTFSSIAAQLHEILEGSTVVAHNVAFDLDMLTHEFQLAGVPAPTVRPQCTMVEVMKHLKTKRWVSLRDAMESQGLFYDVRFGHRAAYDAECARALKAVLPNIGA